MILIMLVYDWTFYNIIHLFQVYKVLESSKYYGAFLNSTSYLKWVLSLLSKWGFRVQVFRI